MRKSQLEKLRRRLEQRLVELYNASHAQARAHLAAEGDILEPRDEGDSAQVAQEEDLRNGIAEGQAALAQRIEEALRRIRSGEFGRCLDCDSEIDLHRLEAVPWASRCAECQESFEGTRRAPTL